MPTCPSFTVLQKLKVASPLWFAIWFCYLIKVYKTNYSLIKKKNHRLDSASAGKVLAAQTRTWVRIPRTHGKPDSRAGGQRWEDRGSLTNLMKEAPGSAGDPLSRPSSGEAIERSPSQPQPHRHPPRCMHTQADIIHPQRQRQTDAETEKEMDQKLHKPN